MRSLVYRIFEIKFSLNMSFVLELSGNTSILSAEYFPPILLDGPHELALLSFQSWNSVSNINSRNNCFYYFDGSSEKVIQIPEGAYEITDIQTFLQQALKLDHSKHPLNPDQKIDLGDEAIILVGHSTTFQCELICRYLVDFSKPNNIGQILGFAKSQKAEPFKKCFSQDIIRILVVETIEISCSLISNSFLNSNKSQILHQVSVLEPPGYRIHDFPSYLIYLPVLTNEISNITLTLHDQNGRLIDFRKEHINIRLHLRKIK